LVTVNLCEAWAG